MITQYAIIADNGGSDQKYRDVVGEVYTFPSMYANILTEGTKFVYQRCSKSSMKVAEPDNERLLDEAHYFGTAEIGPVKEIGGGLFEAEIINYKHFKHGVPFRLSDGSHFEVLPGYFWRNGVRYSQQEVYDEISKAGFGAIPTTTPTAGISPIASPRTAIPIENKRKTAKNRSSVQVKSVINKSLSSKTFFNDTLEIVTDKDGYWLHFIVTDKYYRIAHQSRIKYNEGEIKILRGLISKVPILYNDTRFSIRHAHTNTQIEIGTIEITDDYIEFKGSKTSEKTIDTILRI